MPRRPPGRALAADGCPVAGPLSRTPAGNGGGVGGRTGPPEPLPSRGPRGVAAPGRARTGAVVSRPGPLPGADGVFGPPVPARLPVTGPGEGAFRLPAGWWGRSPSGTPPAPPGSPAPRRPRPATGPAGLSRW
ncbi:hypothetical protein GCM10027160_53360 [Streptomyces calidiresistens]